MTEPSSRESKTVPFCLDGKHFWPKHSAGGSMRTIGEVWQLQCNNCCAVKMVQEWMTSWNDNGYFYEGRLTVIEPEGMVLSFSGFREYGSKTRPEDNLYGQVKTLPELQRSEESDERGEA